jgi:hypothetical protein
MTPEQRKTYNRQYYGRHKEKMKQDARAYYHEHRDDRIVQMRRYYAEHAEESRSYCRQYRKDNLEKLLEYDRHRDKTKRNANAKRWRKEHPEKAKESDKRKYQNNSEKIRAYVKEWKKANPDRVKAWARQHYKANLTFRIAQNVRCRLRIALRTFNTTRLRSGKLSIEELCGCKIGFLRQHLESLFQPGMNWENWEMRGWHVDHVIPCAAFDLTDPEQQKKCFHYTNLQPMWWRQNLSKGKKVRTDMSEA